VKHKKHQKKRKILEELLGRTRGKKLRRQVKARYERARWLQPTSKSHFLAFGKKTPFRVGPLEKAFFGQTSKKIIVKADQVYNRSSHFTNLDKPEIGTIS